MYIYNIIIICNTQIHAPFKQISEHQSASTHQPPMSSLHSRSSSKAKRQYPAFSQALAAA